MIRKAALQIGVPALLALIAWNAYVAVNHLKQVQKIAALTLESSALQAQVSGALKDLTDMESGQRGYLLTGNPDYLQPYTDANARIATDFANLRAALASSTKNEQSLEAQLESLAASKQAEMERSIGLRQRGYRHRSFMLVDTNEGKQYMDDIRRTRRFDEIGMNCGVALGTGKVAHATGALDAATTMNAKRRSLFE